MRPGGGSSEGALHRACSCPAPSIAALAGLSAPPREVHAPQHEARLDSLGRLHSVCPTPAAGGRGQSRMKVFQEKHSQREASRKLIFHRLPHVSSSTFGLQVVREGAVLLPRRPPRRPGGVTVGTAGHLETCFSTRARTFVRAQPLR